MQNQVAAESKYTAMADFNQQSKHSTVTDHDLPDHLSEECTNPACSKKIRELEQQLERLKSVGYDILKQRGAWQMSGQKPANSSLDFNNLFDHEVEDVVRGLRKDRDLREDEARVLVCQEFQKMYEKCKELIFKKLMNTLYKVFLIGSDNDSDEQLFDVCRAYGLLLNASGILHTPVHEEVAEDAHSDLKSTLEGQTFTKKASKLSWDLLTSIPPLISAEPCSDFYREWHEKELPPTWNKDFTDYELVYYRPILFMSCEGKVTRKGWVGNREISLTQSPMLPVAGMMFTDVLPTSTSDGKHVSQASKRVLKELPNTSHIMTSHSCKPRGTNQKAPRQSISSQSKTRFDIDTTNANEDISGTHGATQGGLYSDQQRSPVKSQYYPQRTYYADKDEESSSHKTATTSSTTDSKVWTGETMWRIRP